MQINIPLYYIVGHIEGEIKFNKKEEKEFKELLIKESKDDLSKKEMDELRYYKYQIIDSCNIIVDDYSFEDWDLLWQDLLEKAEVDNQYA